MPIPIFEQEADLADDPAGENVIFTTKTVLSNHEGQDVANVFTPGGQKPVENLHVCHRQIVERVCS
jgi:hypothetical protein